MPRFEAITTNGDNSFSNARFKNEKHSTSSICTSSMNSTCDPKLTLKSYDINRQGKLKLTPGIISALPSSLHSATFVLIWVRSSGLISPVSPANRARKPCVLLLMTSISCNETVCTTSLRFCSSPSGQCTNFVWFGGLGVRP